MITTKDGSSGSCLLMPTEYSRARFNRYNFTSLLSTFLITLSRHMACRKKKVVVCCSLLCLFAVVAAVVVAVFPELFDLLFFCCCFFVIVVVVVKFNRVK